MIIQSCNGLFLCSSLPSRITFFVINFTTNKFTTLVPPAAAAPTQRRRPLILGYALAFDPFISPHYKVVFLWASNGDDMPNDYISPEDFRMEIYSSETRSWKLVDSTFGRISSVDYKRGVYCNGAVHWVGTNTEMSYYNIDEDRLGYVNKPLPKDRWLENIEQRIFQESQDGSRLYLIDNYRPSHTQFRVLEMARDYSGWFTKYHVDLDRISTPHPRMQWRETAILFIDEKENEADVEDGSSVLMLHSPGKVISHNLTSKTFTYSDLTPMAGINDFRIRVDYQNH